MAHKNVAIQEVSSEQLGPHQPEEGADESWQESWGFAWHDPHAKAGGINHISIQRLRGIAEVWSWVALHGRVVGKYQHLNLKPPEADFPDWSLGGQTVTTKSGRECHLRDVFDTAEFDLDYEAWTDPIVMSLDVEGSTWGSTHYESIGRAQGVVRTGGDSIPVDAMAWQDHSWGPRTWHDALSHRWMMANFGPELFLSVTVVITEAGPQGVPFGFVYDHGELYTVDRCSLGARIADDGHSPLGCDSRLWTREGTGLHVTGDVHTSSPSSHLEGFWFTDGLAQFECGGRLGAGIFEAQELNRPGPWHRGPLGIDKPDAYPPGTNVW